VFLPCILLFRTLGGSTRGVAVKTGLAAAVLLVLLASGGCGGASEDPDAASSAQSLWTARVPYVGENSRVASLVNEIGVAGAGSYRLELHTAEPPYALTIALTDPGKPFDTVDFSGPATLLLGLVTNLDEVFITAGQSGYSLSAAAASRDLGYDVKQLGRDQPSLEQYLAQASD
jgi:Domain of unknown function (DUF4825)